MQPMIAPRFKFGVLTTLVIAVVLPLAGTVLLHLDLSNWRWIHERLHTVVEGTGALIALAVALLLLLQRRVQQDAVHFIWVSGALIAMGVLDEFHSWLHAGAAFVWTHSMATLVGGLLFSLIWLPERLARTRLARALPALVAACAIVIGTLIIVFSGQFPVMMSGDSFTFSAKAINFLGGLFFISAGVCFVLRYRTRGSKSDLLFANLCLLFGGAGVLFAYSRLWDAEWWYWHLLRLLAYFVVLGYAFSVYSRLQEELRDNVARSRALLNAIPDLIFRFHLDGTLLDFQLHKGSQNFKAPPQMVVGANIYDSPMRREVVDQIMAASRHAIETGDVQTIEFAYPKASELCHYEARIVTSGSKELVAVLRNITEHKRAQENIRQMAAIVESSDDAIYSKTLDGVIVSWNRGAERVYGYSYGEVLGRPVSLLFPPDHSDEQREVLKRVHQGETIERFKTESLHKDGRRIAISVSVSPIRNAKGEIAGSFTITRDVTEQRQAEEARRESEERVRLLLNSTAEGIFGMDMKGTCNFVNPAALRLLRFDDPSQVLGQNIHLLAHHTRADGTPYPVEECRSGQAARRGEGIHVDDEVIWRSDGTCFPAEYWSYPVRRGEEVVGVVVTFVDITDRIQARDAVRQSQEELRALAGRLIYAKEEEGKRLARELHDVFSQRLAVLGMEVSALQQHSPPFNDKLQGMGDEIARLAKDVHQLSRQMHPSILDDLGLTAALRAECGAFSQQHGIAAQFLPTDLPDSLPGMISLSLYRIAQEGLWNVAKHAQAQEVRLIVSVVDGELRLAVEDDGKGFEPGQTKGRGGLGLVSMEERARLVRGSFSIQSQPGKGTRVEVRIPLPHRDV